MSRVLLRGLPLVAFVMILAPAAWSATAGKSDGPRKPDFADTVARTTTQTEEVIVSGRLDKLSAVRNALMAAEDHFLSRYNELNDDWRYDVTCITEAPTGTRIPVRHCEPGYVANAKREAAVYGLLRYGNQNDWPVRDAVVFNTQLAELQAKMRAIVEGDVELQRALVERSLLAERFQKILKKKFERNWMVWD